MQLMQALSIHLRPAPYPYGLLTLRLLGKLGGKNRRVLREPIDICDPKHFEEYSQQIALDCRWALTGSDSTPAESMEICGESIEDTKMGASTLDDTEPNFSLELPLERCVQVLKQVALSHKPDISSKFCTSSNQASETLKWKESERLWDMEIDKIDLLPYCADVIVETQRSQVEAAMTVLRVALTSMVAVDELGLEYVDVTDDSSVTEKDYIQPIGTDLSFDIQTAHSNLMAYNKDLEMAALGLMLGCTIDSVQDESLSFVKGFLTNLFLTVASHQKHFVRVDANGSSLHPRNKESESEGDSNLPTFSPEEGLGSLKPFGYFEQSGPLRHTTNPMAVNRSLAEFLSQPSSKANDVGLELLKHLTSLPTKLRTMEKNSDVGAEKTNRCGLDRGSTVFFENLLSVLCEQCISSDWKGRDGLYKGICLLIEALGQSWSQMYELEIMNVVLFSLKSTPKEISIAAAEGFQFLIRVCSSLYGLPKYFEAGEGPFVFDILSVLGGKNSPPIADDKPIESSNEVTSLFSPCDDVLQILISEMASTKEIVR